MKQIFAILLFALAGCATKTGEQQPGAAPASQPAAQEQMQGAAAEGELKDCSCTAAPTEGCQPNCPPITWKSKDCDSADGRPRACREPATR